MKAVSTRIDGTSGAFSTAKPACSTCGLCSRPTLPIWPSTSPPSFMLSLICAVVLMSISARSTVESLALMLTPPTRSAAFSLSAIQRAVALLAAPWLNANTEAPRASWLRKASAWIDTNRSACTRRALRTRSCSGTKKSASRVSITRMPGRALSCSRSCSASARTTSFSRSPLGPTAPGSSPPWPGSIATTIRRSTLPACGGATAGSPGADAAATGGSAGTGVPGDEAAGAPGAAATRGGLSSLPMNSPSASCTAFAACCSALSFSRISASSGSRSCTGYRSNTSRCW